MNLSLLFAILEAAPSLIGDVESAVTAIKGDTQLAAKVSTAIAGIEKLAGDLLPALKSL